MECLRVPERASLKPDGFQIDRLFVYGSLMRGLESHHYLAGAVFVEQAWTQGTLVSLGDYPGLIAGGARVNGELYRLADTPAALEVLDDFEDFDPADPERSLFVRSLAEIHGEGGGVFTAWLYLFNQDVAGAPVISSGDWRNPATG